MMPGLDILLIAPPLLWDDEHRPEMKPPLNLVYLATWLTDKGYNAAVTDAAFERMSLKDVLAAIAAANPLCVGIPFYQATKDTCLSLCESIKREWPHKFLIAGGPLATTSPAELLENRALDLCVIGEGELTLEELIAEIRKKRLNPEASDSFLKNIAGIAYRSHGKVQFNQRRDHISDLDSLPKLRYDLIDIHGYFSYHAAIDMSDWLFIATSRGCDARCVFCATPVLWPGRMRRQSVGRIIEEIKFQRNLYPTAQFGFMDDSFFSDKKWLKEFTDEIAGLSVKYCCIGRADHLDEPAIRSLAASGCIYIAFGIETGSQLRQKKINKHLNLGLVKDRIRILSRYEIFSKGFFMLGFPDETPEEMVETINFACELKELGMGECSFFPVSVYAGTELANQVNRDSCVSKVYRPGKSAFDDDQRLHAEEKLLRYANVPAAQINQTFVANQVLAVVKLAYEKFASSSRVSLEELLRCSERQGRA